MRRSEVKYDDTFFRANAVNWGGAELGILNNPPQGITDTSRIGDTIYCKSMFIRHSFLRLDSTTCDFVRVIYIQDYRNTISSITDLLASSFSDAAAIYANYVWDKRRDYKVLWDRIVNISPGLRSAAYFTTKIRLKCRTQFNGATTTIEQNAIKCFMITDQSPLIANFPAYSADVRLMYTDS